MVGHLGKYHDKHVELSAGEPLSGPGQSAGNQAGRAQSADQRAGQPRRRAARVRVELRERRRQAELIFTDNGCGMTPEVLEHLFEPFFTRRRSGQGTGLGLSIVYRIIADHEGAIEVHSDGPGRGSTFRVRLPLAESHKEIEPSLPSRIND